MMFTLKSAKEKCIKRNFNVFDILPNIFRSNISDKNTKLKSYHDHNETLYRNMLAFGVGLENIPKDGDCCVRSILRACRYTISESTNVSNHHKLLGLNHVDEEHDIHILRYVIFLLHY